MQRDIRVGVIGWIDAAGPWPIPLGSGTSTVKQGWADLSMSPAGVVRTYMGLMATTNRAPPHDVDFASYRKTQDFRALVWAHISYADPQPHQITPVQASFVGRGDDGHFVDPGYTPPVDVAKVGAMGKMLPFTKARAHVKDRTWHPAEKSSLSDIRLGGRHPNSVLQGAGRGEPVIANGLIRFRAGTITDDRGVGDAEAPFHVPWVWAEFLLTSVGRGGVRLRGASSQFPTIAWYLDDKQVGQPHAQTTDASFPMSGPVKIDTGSLRIWPVLQAGAPSGHPEPPATADDKYKGQVLPVTSLEHTCPGAPYLDVLSAAAPAGPSAVAPPSAPAR